MTTMMIDCDTTPDDFRDVVGSKVDVLKASVSVTPPQPSAVKRWNVLWRVVKVLRNPTFQQDNARPHIAGIVRTFLDTKNVRLLPWSARSPDLLPIENFWCMAAERLARHHTTVDELWHHVEAARGICTCIYHPISV
ncbi:hypothetical protein TNCV_882981 [Trichonephila clavipes]|nr:hypothetical protein TNCV_882981 [Trichonephila clavipes]